MTRGADKGVSMTYTPMPIPSKTTQPLRSVLDALEGISCGSSLESFQEAMALYHDAIAIEGKVESADWNTMRDDRGEDMLHVDAFGNASLSHLVIRMLQRGLSVHTMAYRLYAVLKYGKDEGVKADGKDACLSDISGNAVTEVLVPWLIQNVSVDRMREVVVAFDMILDVMEAVGMSVDELDDMFLDHTYGLVGEIERHLEKQQARLDITTTSGYNTLSHAALAGFHLYLIMASRMVNSSCGIVTYPAYLLPALPGYKIPQLSTVQEVNRFVAEFPSRGEVDECLASSKTVIPCCVVHEEGDGPRIHYVAPLWEHAVSMSYELEAMDEPFAPIIDPSLLVMSTILIEDEDIEDDDDEPMCSE